MCMVIYLARSVNFVVILLLGSYFINYVACAAGYFSIPGTGTCDPCPPNSVSQPGASECDCIANFYTVSPNNCLPCPTNSVSQAGSDVCICVSDYYRTSDEGPSDPCTSEEAM